MPFELLFGAGVVASSAAERRLCEAAFLAQSEVRAVLVLVWVHVLRRGNRGALRVVRYEDLR